MILKLDIERVRTIDEIRDLMAGSEPVDFRLTDRRGAYDFVTRTLRRLSYAGLSKADTRVKRHRPSWQLQCDTPAREPDPSPLAMRNLKEKK